MSLLSAVLAMEVVLRMEGRHGSGPAYVPSALSTRRGPSRHRNLTRWRLPTEPAFALRGDRTRPHRESRARRTNRRADGTVEPSSNFRASSLDCTLGKDTRCPTRRDWAKTEQARRGQTAFKLAKYSQYRSEGKSMLNRISPHLGTPAQLRLAATEPTCEEDKCSEAISSISKHWTHPPSSLKHVPTTPSQQPHRQLEAFRHVTEQFGSTSPLEPRLSRSLRGRHYGIAIPPSSSPRHERRHTRRHTFDLPPGPSFLHPQPPGAGPRLKPPHFP